jgi:SAM-dependent methyltransferase
MANRVANTLNGIPARRRGQPIPRSRLADEQAALSEMRRVLKPGGRYLFVEHGRSREEPIVQWQDRLNPMWNRLTDGCHINRPIDRLVERGGFELTSLREFQGKGPAVVSSLYRGIAVRD